MRTGVQNTLVNLALTSAAVAVTSVRQQTESLLLFSVLVCFVNLEKFWNSTAMPFPLSPKKFFYVYLLGKLIIEFLLRGV